MDWAILVVLLSINYRLQLPMEGEMDVITLLIAVTCSLHMFPCPSLRLVNLSKL